MLSVLVKEWQEYGLESHSKGNIPFIHKDNTHMTIYILHNQLYEYNKPETIICSHQWAALICSQQHQLSSCSTVSHAVPLLLCL